MIHQLAVKWADRWAEDSIIDAQKKEHYQYGFELLISTFLNSVWMIAVSCIIRMPLAFLPYSLIYAPLRLSAGGYHADSHWKCVLYTQSTFAASVLLTKQLQGRGAYLLLIILSGIVIFLLAPMESENNPMTEKERKRERRRAVLLELIIMTVTVLAVCFSVTLSWFVWVCIAANASVAFSMITARCT